MWYKYTMEYYSAIRKNEIMPFAAIWIDLETVILSVVRHRKTNIISPVCKSIRMGEMNFFTKQKESQI